jgi:hypothetical protein
MEYISVDQNRERWRAPVNVVIKCEEFLDKLRN